MNHFLNFTETPIYFSLRKVLKLRLTKTNYSLDAKSLERKIRKSATS